MTTAPLEHLRGCDVCGSRLVERLHRQNFLVFDDETGLGGYTVAACGRCGFVYADDLPDQTAFDDYYRDLSKYEAEDVDGTLPAWKVRIHDDIVAELVPRFPDRELRILDVGAATGNLLATFARAGYRNAVGFDPSPRCAQIAADLYGVRVQSTSLAQMKFGAERFDLILMASVLEHVRDLGSVIRDLRDLLTPSGALWVEVPDAARFAEFVTTPYQQFSIEHINFFSAATLGLLMARHGLSAGTCWDTVRSIFAMRDPGLDGLFRAGDPSEAVTADTRGVAEVKQYIASCARLERDLVDRTQELRASQTPVLVWGTGSLTLSLLAQSAFRDLHITAFVDANRNYHGKTLLGKPVVAPADVMGRSEDILVVSHASEAAIIDDIVNVHGLPNAVRGLTGGASRPRA